MFCIFVFKYFYFQCIPVENLTENNHNLSKSSQPESSISSGQVKWYFIDVVVVSNT